MDSILTFSTRGMHGPIRTENFCSSIPQLFLLLFCLRFCVFTFILLVTIFYKLNIKKIAFGNKEHTTDLENGSFCFIETLHKQ